MAPLLTLVDAVSRTQGAVSALMGERNVRPYAMVRIERARYAPDELMMMNDRRAPFVDASKRMQLRRMLVLVAGFGVLGVAIGGTSGAASGAAASLPPRVYAGAVDDARFADRTAKLTRVRRRSRPLVFGIYPGGAAGAVGPGGDTKPEVGALRLAALEQLRSPGRPFVVHLYDSFTRRADTNGLPAPLGEQIAGYTGAGFQVELVLTYRPADPEGDVAGFVGFVRSRVRQLGADDGVTAVQVTNEANVGGAPNAADGFYRGATDALVQGVVAAKQEVRRGRFGQLKVGFNWAYQLGPSETAFWRSLGADGGAGFSRAVDWVGIDAYPGTWGPPLGRGDLAGATRDATVRALRALRRELMPLAGLGRVPIRFAESGYPTGAQRTEAMQATVLRAAVGAVWDYRRRFNVSDYRWFDLRDADSASGSFESHYGLLRDDYSPKPAFEAFRSLVASRG
jgi:hypothetical protein